MHLRLQVLALSLDERFQRAGGRKGRSTNKPDFEPLCHVAGKSGKEYKVNAPPETLLMLCERKDRTSMPQRNCQRQQQTCSTMHDE